MKDNAKFSKLFDRNFFPFLVDFIQKKKIIPICLFYYTLSKHFFQENEKKSMSAVQLMKNHYYDEVFSLFSCRFIPSFHAQQYQYLYTTKEAI